jgi:hypothetical protein
METLKRDQIEVAIVYSGNPCQLAFVHALGIPFIYYDLEGFTDETVIASGTPWNLNALSSRATPQIVQKLGPLLQLFNAIQLIRETICQSGWIWLGRMLCNRVSKLDEPISRIFIEDYEIRKRFKPFPHINLVRLCLVEKHYFYSDKTKRRTVFYQYGCFDRALRSSVAF